jgi:GntR family transcriptional regulator
MVLESVRKDGAEPPSLQVYRMIAGEISRGALGPGGRLPAERELSAQLGVSRATLRVALNALHDDGLVEPAHGRGWHVVEPGVVEEGQDPPLSFTELAAARGLVATADVLYREVRPATIEEADELGIAPGSDVFCLDRLRRLDGVPVAVSSSCMPVALVGEIVAVDFTTTSLYAALRERCQLHPSRADYVLQAQGAAGTEARQLGLEEGEAVLVGSYTCFDEADRAFEVGRMTYRGDRYRFRTVLREGPRYGT